MKKTTIEGLSLAQVNEMLTTIAMSESILCNSDLIRSDMVHSLREFNNNYVDDWYCAIRMMGVESGFSTEYIKKQLNDLGNAHIAIKVSYDWDKETYTMKINNDRD